MKHITYRLYTFIILFCVIFFILGMFTPLVKKHLIIIVNADQDSQTQLFYRSENQDFVEDKSILTPIYSGSNYLSFDIPLGKQFLRWDPILDATAGSEMQVKTIYLRTAFMKFYLTSKDFSPITSIKMISNQEDHLTIAMQGTDPQVYLAISNSKILIWQLLVLSILSSLISVFAIRFFFMIKNKFKQFVF